MVIAQSEFEVVRLSLQAGLAKPKIPHNSFLVSLMGSSLSLFIFMCLAHCLLFLHRLQEDKPGKVCEIPGSIFRWYGPFMERRTS